MVAVVERNPKSRRKDGTLTRPQTWERALDLCLHGHEYRWTSRKQHACDKGTPAPERAQDFASKEPEQALEALMTVAAELVGEGDETGARHWQALADDLAAWIEADSFTDEHDPWAEPEREPQHANATKSGRPTGRYAWEVEAFFDAIRTRSASGARFMALMRLVYFTGIRIGEALELDIDDLDWASGCVHIRKGKTPNARRMAMMPADPDKVALLMADVNRWLKWRNAWNPTTRLLFVSNPNGKGRATTGLHYQSVQRTCHTVSERAGIRPLTPHQLRHTYISVLIANGAPITGITRQAGHSSSAVTMRSYAWCVSREQEEAVACF